MTIGQTQLVATGYVAGAAIPTRVFGLIIKADSSGSTVVLKDNGATELDTIAAAASSQTRINYPGGLFFPNGCQITLDAHATYVTVIGAKEY